MTMSMIAGAKVRLDQRAAANDFVDYATLLLSCKNDKSWMQNVIDASGGRFSQRLIPMIKAEPGMVLSPGESPATWGGSALAPDAPSTAFLSSLSNADAFDAAVADMLPRPLKTRVPSSSVAAVGFAVNEGAAKPVAELDLSDDSIEPRKVVSMLVVSEDLLNLGGGLASALIERELRAGVARATDASFVSALVDATTPTASSGSFLEDLVTLLGAISGDSRSRYYVAVEPDAAKTLAVIPGVDGRRAHPDLGTSGGTIANGLRVVVSDQLDAGEVLAFDASQIAADPGVITLDVARHSTLDMAGGNSPAFDLWSKNCRALKAERMFGFKLLRATAAASISGADYSASGSP